MISTTMSEALMAAGRQFDERFTFRQLARPDKSIARVRGYVFAYLRAANAERYSFPVLGRLFRRHHTTVLHGVRQAHAEWGEEHFDLLVNAPLFAAIQTNLQPRSAA